MVQCQVVSKPPFTLVTLYCTLSSWLAARHPDKVKSLSLHSAWTKTDPFLNVAVESWQVMAQGLGSVPEMVIRWIFLWCYTPELYASRPEYIDALAAFVRGRLVQPLDACMRQSQAVLAHDAQSQLGRIQAPTHPSMSKWRSLTGRRGRFCSGTPGRGSWLFSIIADQHQAADKGAYLQLAAWDPGIWSLVSQRWFVIIMCSGIAGAGILHEATQLRLWDQQRTPG